MSFKLTLVNKLNKEKTTFNKNKSLLIALVDYASRIDDPKIIAQIKDLSVTLMHNNNFDDLLDISETVRDLQQYKWM